jgi:hypothetical protein
VKQGTPNHPKVYALAEALHTRRASAIGFLEALWHFTANYAPDGNLARYPAARIEAACAWGETRRDKPGRLLEALIEQAWLDMFLATGPVKTLPIVDRVATSKVYKVVPLVHQFGTSSALLVHDWPQHCERSVLERCHFGAFQFHPLYTAQQLSRKTRTATAPRTQPPSSPLLSSPNTTPPTPPLALGGETVEIRPKRQTRAQAREQEALDTMELLRKGREA